MLRSLGELEQGFQDISKKSKEKCGDKLEELRRLTFLTSLFVMPYYKCYKQHEAKYGKFGNSLNGACLLELFRISGHIVFLSSNGLYRNAFDNIRYAIESIVQALYIDSRHPEAPLLTKIEIMKEIEGKREYRAQSLIDKLKLGEHKTKLQTEYAELSQIVHPTHKHIKNLLRDFKEGKGVPTTISCEEISNIYESLRRMYDILFFLVTNNFPEIVESLKKNQKFIRGIKAYNLPLLLRVLKA